jgi:hypothetical protein
VAGTAEDAAAVEAQLSAEAAVAKAADAEDARDAAAEAEVSSAAKLASERAKVERCSLTLYTTCWKRLKLIA